MHASLALSALIALAAPSLARPLALRSAADASLPTTGDLGGDWRAVALSPDTADSLHLSATVSFNETRPGAPFRARRERLRRSTEWTPDGEVVIVGAPASVVKANNAGVAGKTKTTRKAATKTSSTSKTKTTTTGRAAATGVYASAALAQSADLQSSSTATSASVSTTTTAAPVATTTAAAATATTTTAATTTSSAASSATTYSGEATYYYQTGEVNCPAYDGGKVTDDMLVTAISQYHLYGTGKKLGQYCGDMINVSRGSNTVKVRVVDSCESCAATHLDLSPTAFEQLGVLDDGILEVTWAWA